MDFRRFPYQFSSGDPTKRQVELQKKFVLPAKDDSKDKMHVDFLNTFPEGAFFDDMDPAYESPRAGSPSIAPKRQKESDTSSAESSPSTGRKPHVRMVPIEVIGDSRASDCHRNVTVPSKGNSFVQNGVSWMSEPFSSPKYEFLKARPHEHTIPIKVETTSPSKKVKTVPVQTRQPPAPKKETEPVLKDPPKVEAAASTKILAALSLKKIGVVLEKLKTYLADVENFTGSIKDKQYRYLDEMLTRLMLDLDDIDTMGIEEVRLARKAAVRQVQSAVDLLEVKVTEPATERSADAEMEMVSSSQEDGAVDNNVARTEEKVQVVPKPAERESQVVTEPAEEESQVVLEPAAEDQSKTVEEVDMENEAEVSGDVEVTQEACESTVERNQPIYVDADSHSFECEPVVTTTTPEPAKPSETVTDLRIEEVGCESVDASEPDSSVNELCVSEELDCVPTSCGPASEVNMGSVVLPDGSDKIILGPQDTVSEIVSKSSCASVANEDVSNLDSVLVENDHCVEML